MKFQKIKSKNEEREIAKDKKNSEVTALPYFLKHLFIFSLPVAAAFPACLFFYFIEKRPGRY
jgi:hypothetical protein